MALPEPYVEVERTQHSIAACLICLLQKRIEAPTFLVSYVISYLISLNLVFNGDQVFI